MFLEFGMSGISSLALTCYVFFALPELHLYVIFIPIARKRVSACCCLNLRVAGILTLLRCILDTYNRVVTDYSIFPVIDRKSNHPVKYKLLEKR